MLPRKPLAQARGRDSSTETWKTRVIQPATWKDPLRSDPENIIMQFKDGRFTQGLALTISWGGMGRQPINIYRDGSQEAIDRIEKILLDCANNIRESHSIEHSWKTLTGTESQQLGWSGVMASKALHFLCRSLGYLQNPPVQIDGAVIRQRLWPLFRYSLPFGRTLANWECESFEAYCRYMTAILTWAEQRDWTTVEMEATIYAHFSPL